MKKFSMGAAVLTAGVAFLSPAGARAGVISELGNAGDMPGTAQLDSGTGSLDAIDGRLTGNSDVDMFAIWVSSPATFSATTDGLTGGGTAYDTQLFLLTSSGMGLYANDDISHSPTYNPRSVLSAGSMPLLTAGLHYLAISGWDRDPISAGGQMFNDDTVFVGTATATGPGGGQVITGWNGNGNQNGGTGRYSIALSGASFVPEPGALVLLGIGAVVGAFSLRRGA